MYMFSNKKIIIAAIAATIAIILIAAFVGYSIASKSQKTTVKKIPAKSKTESAESQIEDVLSYYTKDETFKLFDYLKDRGMHPKRKYSEEGQKGYESVGVISIRCYINGWDIRFEEDGEITAFVDKSNPDDKDDRASTFYNTAEGNKIGTNEKTTYILVGREMIKDLPRIIDAFKKQKAEFGKNPFPNGVPIGHEPKDR